MREESTEATAGFFSRAGFLGRDSYRIRTKDGGRRVLPAGSAYRPPMWGFVTGDAASPRSAGTRIERTGTGLASFLLGSFVCGRQMAEKQRGGPIRGNFGPRHLPADENPDRTGRYGPHALLLVPSTDWEQRGGEKQRGESIYGDLEENVLVPTRGKARVSTRRNVGGTWESLLGGRRWSRVLVQSTCALIQTDVGRRFD